MSNTLIPEVRVDKNGVSVTRHVRPQSTQPGKSLPKPVLVVSPTEAPYPERESDIARLTDKCSEFFSGGRYSGDISGKDFAANIDSYSDSTIKLLTKYVGDGKHQTFYAQLTSLMERPFREQDIREYVMYSPEVIDCEDLNETLQYVRGLRYYKQFKSLSDLTTASKEQETSARALLRIAFRLHSESWMSGEDHPAAASVLDYDDDGKDLPVIKSPSLVSLVLENPSRASDIAEYIEEHGFKTTKALKEMLEDTHHATRDGWL